MERRALYGLLSPTAPPPEKKSSSLLLQTDFKNAIALPPQYGYANGIALPPQYEYANPMGLALAVPPQLGPTPNGCDPDC